MTTEQKKSVNGLKSSLEFLSTARQDVELCVQLAHAATSVLASVFMPVTDVFAV